MSLLYLFQEYQIFIEMNPQKVFLINSTNKLIWHIAKNNAAKEEIFVSLENIDFQKILSNLTDSNLQLRLTSAQLVGQLLYNSEKNQVRFCQSLNIHYQKQSELILNQNIGQIISEYPQRAMQIFNLIKIHHEIRTLNNSNIDTLIWFINPSRGSLRIEYLSSQQINQMKIRSRKGENPEQIGFDPKNCIFGILLNSMNKELTSRTPSLTDITSQMDSFVDMKPPRKSINNKNQPIQKGKINKSTSSSPNKIQIKEKEYPLLTPRSEISSIKKSLIQEFFEQNKSIDKFHKHRTLPTEEDLTPENRKKPIQIGQYATTIRVLRPHSQLVPSLKSNYY